MLPGVMRGGGGAAGPLVPLQPARLLSNRVVSPVSRRDPSHHGICHTM
jgi:hypothetical protein